jgi:hypothetical protein
MGEINKKLKHLLQFESETIDAIDDSKSDYLDDDWESEFDDIHEAYDEQGRGEAESQAVQDLIRREFPGVSDKELLFLMDELSERWGISYN